MKSEYLITFEAKDSFCTTVKKFKSLISSHAEISFKNGDVIVYKECEFSYQLAQGTLTDSSIYYDLILEDSKNENHEKYKQLAREIRTICTRSSGRQIIILHDGIGEEYCIQGYPTIYKTENLMRKLIAKFMAISIGYDWSDNATPKEVLDSVRSEGKKEKTNFLQEVDFIQLSNFLFKKYSKADSLRFIESIKEKEENETISVKDLKQYIPFTNWERYFSIKVNCDSEYLKTKWERLYDYRCKIAHCKGITKSELDDLQQISKDLCEKIQSALDSIGDLHIEDADREELAENLSGTANSNVAEFITKYNKLQSIVYTACILSSNENDIFEKHKTNHSNILMQCRYLYANKKVIPKETMESITNAQRFRNKIVHGVGIVELSESELVEESNKIDEVLEELSNISYETLVNLKGVDYKNSNMQAEI
ncbi:hypothetical protein K4H28_15195 [Deefgea tanakiae]|uniref:Apea-like HEPN domain-containing protein n=1 Tax=Deefgea tanakiae TaxID=2865840 RepID=A0ABX8Z4V7_9NEIS|nr:HEPN domain-containing protein [Deefgea tanakiae]QZA77601.1 hypothetical protein K4H28_15195 [Deefgea tanakiae]